MGLHVDDDSVASQRGDRGVVVQFGVGGDGVKSAAGGGVDRPQRGCGAASITEVGARDEADAGGMSCRDLLGLGYRPAAPHADWDWRVLVRRPWGEERRHGN